MTARRAAELSLLAFVFLMGFDWPPPPIPAHAAWADAFMLIAGLCGAWAWRRGQLTVRLDTILFAAAAYVGWAAVSALHAGAGAWKVLGIAELATMMVLARALAGSAPYRDQLLKSWVLGVAVLCVLGLCGSVLALAGVHTSLSDTVGGELGLVVRPKGLCVTIDMLAALGLVPLLVVCKTQVFRTRGRRLLTSLLALTLLATAARTLLAAALGLLLASPAHRITKCLGTSLLALGLLVSMRIDVHRPTGGALRVSLAPGIHWRIAASALATIARAPLFGVGPNAPAASVGWPGPEDLLKPVDAHLTPLNILATLGAPALVSFAFVVLFVWRRRRRVDEVDALLAIALVATLFDSITVDVEDLRPVWLLFGLLARTSNSPVAGDALP